MGRPTDEGRRRRALDQIRPYIERARRFSGWDFNSLNVRALEPEPPWDYEAIARDYASRAERVLDMGTGGGEAAGLTVDAQEHAWKVAYATLGDLVFQMLVTPWEVPDFDPEREIDTLLALEDACGGEHGIVLTEHRYLMTAQKPG